METTNPGDCTSVCELPAPQLEERVAEIQREIMPHVLRQHSTEREVEWELANHPDMRQRLEAFITFERRCCSSLRFALSTDRAGSPLRLTIRGEGAGAFALLGAPPSPTAGTGKARQIASAGGIGLAMALFVCCLLPSALAALGAVAIVAPLARLDHPLAIAALSLAMALPVWLWMRRSDRASCADC